MKMKFGWTTFSRAIILFQWLSLTILLCPLHCCYGYHSRSPPFTLDKKDGTTTTRGPIRSCISPYYSVNNQDNRHRITRRKSKQRRRSSSVCCSFAFVNDANNDDNDYYDDDDKIIKTISILGQEKMEKIQNMVIQRAKNRWEGRYDIADKIRDEIQNNITLPNGYEISIQDIPRKVGGGSTWNLVLRQDTTNSSSESFIEEEGPTVLQLAHSALGLAVEQSIQYNLRRTQASLLLLPQIDDDDDNKIYFSPSSSDDDDSFFSFYRQQLDTIVQQAKERMSKFSYYTQQQELAGRKAADAAFWFAIAGVTDQQLFTKLIQISIHELQRFGERPSCRPKDIYQILERFAAAGIVSIIADTANNASSSYDINIIDDKDDDDDDICTYCKELEEVAERILKYKNNIQQEQSTTDDDRRDGIGGLLDLHSNRSLLLLWKFSTKQKKQKAFLRSAHKHWEREKYHHRRIKHGKENNNNNSSHNVLPTKTSTTTTTSTAKIQKSISNNKYNWDTIFSDPSRPLVIDIGCGMGVSLLGLAKISTRTKNNVEQQERQRQQQDDDDCYFFSSDLLLNKHTKWSGCNFAGVDLGALGIGYANGVSKRIGLSNRLHYFVDSGEDFVEHIRTTYPGPVLLCLVQFPTPFRLQRGNDMQQQQQQQQQGNSQLPDSAEDGFMVSKDLLRSIRIVLSSSSSSSSTKTTTTGQLLIQSNCEDVAVWMRNMACKTCDFDFINFPVDVVAKDNLLMTTTTKIRQPQRTVDWIAMGGERASGPGWLHSPILPRSASTETEVACSLNGTPVHRCLLRPKFR